MNVATRAWMVALAMVGVLLLGNPAPSHGECGVYPDLTVALYATSLAFAVQYDMAEGQAFGSAMGGFGRFDMLCDYSGYDRWYCIYMYDYGTSRYEMIWWQYLDNL